MQHYEECERCGHQYPSELGFEDEIISDFNERRCACGEKFCQRCTTICDGCKTPICDSCSATHWDTGEELCLSCAQPMYTGIYIERKAA